MQSFLKSKISTQCKNDSFCPQLPYPRNAWPLLRFCRRSRLRRWLMHRRMMNRRAAMQNRNLNDLHRSLRTIVRITRHASDFLNNLNAGGIALAKNCVTAGQARAVLYVFGDKKLRSVGVRPGIGVGQASRLIKGQTRGSFILELEADFACAGSRRVTALNHELRNHAMENGSVVERDPVHLASRRRTDPILGPSRQTDEVGHAKRRLVGK